MSTQCSYHVVGEGRCQFPIAGPETKYCKMHFRDQHGIDYASMASVQPPDLPDMVNHPAHYTRGPKLDVSGAAGVDPGTIIWTIECIDVIRHIKDGRLFTAMKYIWRVAFGGKENDREDIQKAIWFLNDWLDSSIEQS